MSLPQAGPLETVFATLLEPEQRNIVRLSRAPEDAALATRPLRVRSLGDAAYAGRRQPLFVGDEAPGDLPAGVVCLENALVTPRGFVVHGDDLLWDTTYINPGWARGVGSTAIPDVFNANGLWRFDPFRREMLFAAPPGIEQVETPCFLFNSEAAMGNFAHFMHDTMLQVPAFRELAIREPVVPLFVGSGFRLDRTRDLLAWCLARPERDWLLSNYKFLQVRRLYVPLPHVDFAASRIAAAAARRLRALIATALGPIPDGAPQDVYVSRDDTSGLRFDPQVGNPGPFRALLRELGVLEVRASELSGARYFDLFKSARTIIGLHGAGLLNVLLARDGRLLELAVPGAGGDSLTLVSSAAGIPTLSIPHPDVQGGAVEIDLEAVRTAMHDLGRA